MNGYDRWKLANPYSDLVQKPEHEHAEEVRLEGDYYVIKSRSGLYFKGLGWAKKRKDACRYTKENATSVRDKMVFADRYERPKVVHVTKKTGEKKPGPKKLHLCAHPGCMQLRIYASQALCKEHFVAATKERIDAKIKAGICTKCSKPVQKPFKMCEWHLEIERQAYKINGKKRRKQNGHSSNDDKQ